MATKKNKDLIKKIESNVHKMLDQYRTVLGVEISEEEEQAFKKLAVALDIQERPEINEIRQLLQKKGASQEEIDEFLGNLVDQVRELIVLNYLSSVSIPDIEKASEAIKLGNFNQVQANFVYSKLYEKRTGRDVTDMASEEFTRVFTLYRDILRSYVEQSG